MAYKYTAIIIEPRKHKALRFVLQNVCDALPADWGIVLFHGNKNIEYATKIVEKINNIFDNRISMVNLNIDNLDLVEYSRLLATKSIIYDHIHTDLFLVFQTDSMIFKDNIGLLDGFLEYDYIGAPWLICYYYPTQICDFIGNGGFSLRNKNKMFEIIEKVNWNDKNHYIEQYEDLYFSTNYENIFVKKPEYDKARTFCVDEVFSELTMACHSPWKHSHYSHFKAIYPEVEILAGLQGVEED